MKRSTLTIGTFAVIAYFALSPSIQASPTNQAGMLHSDHDTAKNKSVLSVLGSSVAKGARSSGDLKKELINGSYVNGYAAHLTTLEASNGWRVVNQSIGGDTTDRVKDRFYRDEVPVHADAVLIGLSLGNEGLAGAANPQAVYDHFFTGITNLIAMSRSSHLLPVIGDQYPKDAYSAAEYVLLKRMDLQLNTLDVPSVNFLGATDDGAGHWVENKFINLNSGDGTHPSDAGYYEMFLTIVPSVFEAVKLGKPTPQWGDQAHCLHLSGDTTQAAPLSFNPTEMMHSFTMSFRVRSLTTGTVASITLPDSSVHPTIEITSTGLAYIGADGMTNSFSVVGANGAWHEVVLAHQYARGKTWFYVDGALIATVSERLTPIGFILGGKGSATARPDSPAQADYQNWMVYRSMLNAEEVEAQHQGRLQQASLELYAPLDDASFSQGGSVKNLAQSLATARINGASANYHSAVTTH